MNTKLSRRIGRLMDRMSLQGMTLNDRWELAELVDSVNSFEELPEKFQKMIIKAEE